MKNMTKIIAFSLSGTNIFFTVPLELAIIVIPDGEIGEEQGTSGNCRASDKHIFQTTVCAELLQVGVELIQDDGNGVVCKPITRCWEVMLIGIKSLQTVPKPYTTINS